VAATDQIREAIEETPGDVRLFLVLKGGEHLWCTSRRQLTDDAVTVWSKGQKRTVDLDQIADVGAIHVTRSAALAVG
jgi:hypothetical protein